MIGQCRNCNICAFMPEQDEERIPCCIFGERDITQVSILVVDDCADKRDMLHNMERASRLLHERPFIYTTTIRCDYISGEISKEAEEKALNRCAVWTHQLLENRMFILSTLNGLKQMRIGEGRGEGDLWRSLRLGVILCIPPLDRMTVKEFSAYMAKTERVLKMGVMA